jgi:hypothetical protein
LDEGDDALLVVVSSSFGVLITSGELVPPCLLDCFVKRTSCCQCLWRWLCLSFALRVCPTRASQSTKLFPYLAAAEEAEAKLGELRLGGEGAEGEASTSKPEDEIVKKLPGGKVKKKVGLVTDAGLRESLTSVSLELHMQFIRFMFFIEGFLALIGS